MTDLIQSFLRMILNDVLVIEKMKVYSKMNKELTLVFNIYINNSICINLKIIILHNITVVFLNNIIFSKNSVTDE